MITAQAYTRMIELAIKHGKMSHLCTEQVANRKAKLGLFRHKCRVFDWLTFGRLLKGQDKMHRYDSPMGIFDDYEGCESGINTTPIPPCVEGKPHTWIKKLDGYECIFCDVVTRELPPIDQEMEEIDNG